jgi:AbrB family looped-hinge helix DNA binding protein
MTEIRRLTSKGQVTIPASIRKALGLRGGDGVLFQVKNGVVTVERCKSVAELAGTVELKGGFKGWKQLRRETEEWVARRALRRAGMNDLELRRRKR